MVSRDHFREVAQIKLMVSAGIHLVTNIKGQLKFVTRAISLFTCSEVCTEVGIYVLVDIAECIIPQI